MNAFYQATKELNIADRVTLFTASDFGRTFQSNGGEPTTPGEVTLLCWAIPLKEETFTALILISP